jgi:NAD(P)-dependent dehydrogenase (short-subunit alcohol dehydrogenase family)
MQDKRVALVTGANQGIGLQIAKELAAKNFTVTISKIRRHIHHRSKTAPDEPANDGRPAWSTSVTREA